MRAKLLHLQNKFSSNRTLFPIIIPRSSIINTRHRTLIKPNTMHSLTPTLLFLLPSLVLAAPPTPPRISKLTFSGSGCARDNSAKSTSGSLLDDSASFTFADLKGDDSDNCQVHITSQGGSQGWQVAVKEVTYSGDVSLKTGSSLEALTSVFWSENAASTVSLFSVL
jgi:hypothetical protein